jgi:hypothetical protein
MPLISIDTSREHPMRSRSPRCAWQFMLSALARRMCDGSQSWTAHEGGLIAEETPS